MARLAIFIGLCIQFLLGAAVYAAPDASNYESAVVRVINEDVGSGTGFFITTAGHVLTNEHVIARSGAPREDAYSIIHPKTEDIDKARIEKAQLVWKSEQLDLAVLLVESGTAPLTLSLEKPLVKKGTAVYAVGYPGLQDQMAEKLLVESSVTNGEIVLSQERVWQGRSLELTVLSHTAKVNPGNSGGPLINDCSRVVGVNTQISIVDKLQNYSYASAISEAIRELEAQNISPDVVDDYCEIEIGNSESSWVSAINSLGIVVLAALLGLLLWKQPRQIIVEKTRKTIFNMGRSSPPISVAPPAERQQPKAGAGPIARSNTLIMTPGNALSPPLELSQSSVESQRLGLSFGRQPDFVDYAIQETGISRRHFRVSCASGTFFIEDLNSANGTKVNGQALKPYYGRALSSGDVVEAGNASWHISLG